MRAPQRLEPTVRKAVPGRSLAGRLLVVRYSHRAIGEKRLANDEQRPSKIGCLDIDELADEAEDLTGVIRIVGVVFQCIGGGVVDI